MASAETSVSDPKSMVERGYDAIAPAYLSFITSYTSPRGKYFTKLLGMLPPASPTESSLAPPRILELGCGAGVPSTRALVRRGYRVVANDISTAQIDLARAHTSRERYLEDASDEERTAAVAAGAWQEPRFHRTDMMSLDFAAEDEADLLDAALGFYSLIHLPREEQRVLLKRIFSWLRRGGLLLVNLAAEDMEAKVMPGWLGADMYWSSFDAEKNRELVREAGFEILEAEVETEFETEERGVEFLWVIARKN